MPILVPRAQARVGGLVRGSGGDDIIPCNNNSIKEREVGRGAEWGGRERGRKEGEREGGKEGKKEKGRGQAEWNKTSQAHVESLITTASRASHHHWYAFKRSLTFYTEPLELLW